MLVQVFHAAHRFHNRSAGLAQQINLFCHTAGGLLTLCGNNKGHNVPVQAFDFSLIGVFHIQRNNAPGVCHRHMQGLVGVDSFAAQAQTVCQQAVGVFEKMQHFQAQGIDDGRWRFQRVGIEVQRLFSTLVAAAHIAQQHPLKQANKGRQQQDTKNIEQGMKQRQPQQVIVGRQTDQAGQHVHQFGQWLENRNRHGGGDHVK